MNSRSSWKTLFRSEPRREEVRGRGAVQSGGFSRVSPSGSEDPTTPASPSIPDTRSGGTTGCIRRSQAGLIFLRPWTLAVRNLKAKSRERGKLAGEGGKSYFRERKRYLGGGEFKASLGSPRRSRFGPVFLTIPADREQRRISLFPRAHSPPPANQALRALLTPPFPSLWDSFSPAHGNCSPAELRASCKGNKG